jgi:copper(I)-binding protein
MKPTRVVAHRRLPRFALVAAALALCSLAQAQVTVQGAWVRGTVATQKVTGAFMTLTAAAPGKLVEVRTPLAGSVEIHEMAHQDGVMTMRPLRTGLPLPAGQAVELKPGGYHLMLMDLKQPLKAGDAVPLTLVVEGADGTRRNVDVSAEVRPLGAAAAMPMQGGEHDHHKH